MRCLPESLFGRLLTALLAAVGVTLLIIVALIVRERRDLVFWGGDTAEIVDVIGATSNTLTELGGARRAAEIERLRAEPFVLERAFPPREPPRESVAVAARVLRTRLERELGAGYRVSARPAQPGPANVIRVGTQRARAFDRVDSRRGGGPGLAPRQLDVAVRLPDGDVVTFRTDVPRTGPPLPRQIFVQLAILMLVLGAALYFMTRTITRPLGDLAAAAESVGRGARRVPLQERGARELRNATRAFNAMQERLNRYLDSRTRVLAAMSHDLRTPLTRLKLRVESLDDETLRQRFTADLDEMAQMVQGALGLFKGLNEDESAKPVRIDELLEELRTEFAEMGASVTVTGTVAEPLAVRPHALKRCLTNLLSNAVKYGTRAAVLVEDARSDVTIRILDEGPGIPAEMLEQVFEPFFRLEASRSADTGGTGLGLSIARDVAQAHGGTLVLRNRVPHGLEAVLTLPKIAH